MIDCGNCIHVEMCKWCDEMVKNHTCDWYDECGAFVEPKQGEWIPCSERLPDKDGFYLITLENFYDNNLKTRIGFYETSTQCFYPYALAWMPLPKPYRREGEEK